MTSIERRARQEQLQKGRQEGLQEGIQQSQQKGMLQGVRDLPQQTLQVRFGPPPAALLQMIEQCQDVAAMRALSQQALIVSSIAELSFRSVVTSSVARDAAVRAHSASNSTCCRSPPCFRRWRRMITADDFNYVHIEVSYLSCDTRRRSHPRSPRRRSVRQGRLALGQTGRQSRAHEYSGS